MKFIILFLLSFTITFFIFSVLMEEQRMNENIRIKVEQELVNKALEECSPFYTNMDGSVKFFYPCRN